MTIAEKYNWAETIKPFTVEELRVLSAKHGMDVSILIGYNSKENTFSVITSGKNMEFVNNAKLLSEQIMKMVNPQQTKSELLEDRINEHTN